MTNFELNTCEKEYLKDTKIKKDNIRELIKWSEKQPHLPQVEEYMLIQMYHASNYSLQQTKNLVQEYYSLKHEAEDIFSGRDFDPKKYKHSVWDMYYCFNLPQFSPEGCNVLYSSLKNVDISLYNFDIVMAQHFKAILAIILEHGVRPGFVVIFDLKGFSFSHLPGISISSLRTIICFAQDAAPLRMKAIHVINGGKVIDKLLFLAKPFMRKELFEMIYIHSSMNTFFEKIPKEIFPEDVDGTMKCTRDELNEIMRSKVAAFEPALAQELLRSTDETKRISKKTDLTLASASFRKLELD